MTRVNVPTRMLRWALGRSDVPEDRLHRRFEKLREWIDGTRQPTLKQLEKFAEATHTPIGYLFLNEPPQERVPIPDFRTIAGQAIPTPSPNLLDTIYLCQQRQDWFAQDARLTGQPTHSFVGSAAQDDDVIATALRIREALGFDLELRSRFRTWTEALRHFIEQADDLGVLVMINGVVGGNNTRRLNVEEFRGFALSDPLAPLVFVNGADSKSAQMFTLAHELAHLWLGRSALSDTTPATTTSGHAVERWCNQVAAEVLAPLDAIGPALRAQEPLDQTLGRLARQFKVSTLVILRRLHDVGHLNRDRFRAAYQAELQRLGEHRRRSGGGDYYLTTGARVGRRFARAVVVAAWEGRTSFSEAFRLVGCRKTSTLRELGHSVGVDV